MYSRSQSAWKFDLNQLQWLLLTEIKPTTTTKRKWSQRLGIRANTLSFAICLHLSSHVALPSTVISTVPWAALSGPHSMNSPDWCQWPLQFPYSPRTQGQQWVLSAVQVGQVTASCRKPALCCFIPFVCTTGSNLLKWQLSKSYFCLRQLMNRQLSVSVILK